MKIIIVIIINVETHKNVQQELFAPGRRSQDGRSGSLQLYGEYGQRRTTFRLGQRRKVRRVFLIFLENSAEDRTTVYGRWKRSKTVCWRGKTANSTQRWEKPSSTFKNYAPSPGQEFQSVRIRHLTEFRRHKSAARDLESVARVPAL